MGAGAGLCMYDVVVKKFAFAISSSDKFLVSLRPRKGTCLHRTASFDVVWVTISAGPPANTNELVLPSAHQGPQPKWQIDRFSRFCTPHGRKSLYFTVGALSQKLPLPWGIWPPRLTHDSLGPSESTTQTPSRSALRFLHRWSQSVPTLYNRTPLFRSKLSLPMGDLDPI